MQAHTLGEVGTFGTILLRVSSETTLPIYIKIGSHLTDWEQKISWHSFLRHGVYTCTVYISRALWISSVADPRTSPLFTDVWRTRRWPPFLRPTSVTLWRRVDPPHSELDFFHRRRQTTVWVKKSPPPEIFWHFFPKDWEFFVRILHAYYTFLSTLDYKFLFNYLQLWRSYAILCATTIMCSKCPPSTETHAGWSHLIWHNFVIVGDNWIKVCTLACLWTYNVCEILTKNS